MSEWKEHDGGSQPKETMGRRVEYELRDGYRDVIMADEIHWSWTRTPIPQYAQILRYRLLDTPSSEGVEPVKTLRDEFAMAALTGIVGGYWGTEQMSGLGPSEFADEAYQIADAMLAARKEK